MDESWANNLASITLAGPEGTVVLDENTSNPMVILRNPATGQVRGFLREFPVAADGGEAGAEALARERGLKSNFSAGLPRR